MKSAPVLKYPGSKWKIADWIISHFPSHTTYLEPFFGSGAVFFTKKPSKVETINDIDGNVVNLFKVIREQPEELARLIEFTPWARDEYYASYEPIDDPLEKARRFLVKCWQAHNAMTNRKVGWCNNTYGAVGAPKYKQWLRIPKLIYEISNRLRNVQIENQDAITLIKRYNHSDVLIYADPPYILSTRAGRLYSNEMTDEEHKKLLDILKKHSGLVIISGYDNELYNKELKDWNKKYRKSIAQKGKDCLEVIWMNFENPNISLFD